MRVVALALAFCLVGLALVPPPARAEDFGAVGNVNRLIGNVSAPQLAPGDSGTFRFALNSTYADPVYNVRLNVSIYEYATIDTTELVNASWPYPYPRIASTGGREWWWNATEVGPGTATNLSFTVLTSSDGDLMPGGSLFNQASYFLRFWLEFDDAANASGVHYRFASRGFFSAAQWGAAQVNLTDACVLPWCRGYVNLSKLGVDGILPDSAFGVLQPIPRWPFYLLIGLAGLFLVLAFLFWVEENPGTYPRVEAWWARTRGRLRRTVPVRRRSKRD